MDAVVRFHPQSYTLVDSRPLANRALGELFRANLRAQGRTEDEALANSQEAIREYLVVRDELLKEGVVREVEVGR